MNKLELKTIAKFTMVLVIILTMLFSNIAPIIAWAAEVFDDNGKVTESDYVKFNLTWGDNETEISMNDGSIAANFDLQFDTLEKFKSFKIQVEKADLVSVKFENVGEYFGDSSSYTQIQYLKDIPGGTKIAGTIGFKFDKSPDFSDYTRELKVKLIGIYEKDGEEFEVELTRKLTANITSTAIVNPHTAYMNSDLSYVYNTTTSDTQELYSVSKVEVKYYISAGCENAEYTKLECDFYRTASNNDNKYYPTSVTMSEGLQSRGFRLNKNEKEDGTVNYVIEKGQDREEFSKGNLYSFEINNWNCYITVKYDIANPEEDVGTTLISNKRLTSKGYTITTDANGVTNAKTTITAENSTSDYTTLYRYTPGAQGWGTSNIDRSSFLTQEDLEEFVNQDKLDFRFKTYFTYVSGNTAGEDCTITQEPGNISYYNADTNSYGSKTLSKDEMYVKNITVNWIAFTENAWIKFYKQGENEPFFIATYDNLTYTAGENEKIDSYYAVASDILENQYSGWETTYEMCASKMKENGLTEEQILNIRSISKRQSSSGANITANRNEATYNISGYDKEKISHFKITDTNMNSNKSQVSQAVNGDIKLSLTTLGIENRDIPNVDVSNTNPTFFIKLPNQFDFDIASVYFKNINKMKVNNYRIKKVNGDKILEINCEGNNKSEGYREEYNNSTDPTLVISYTRKLKPEVTETRGTLEAYMQTEENKYYISREDIYDYNGNGNRSDKLAYDSLNYSISYNSQIQLSNSAYSALGEIKTNEDVILNKGDTVKYRVVLDNNYGTIKDINLVARLPFEGNKSILGDNLIDLGSDCTFTNLKNIKIYEKTANGVRRELSTNDYTIGYSTEETANLDSEYSESLEDINTAKTIQVKLSDTYRLKKGYQLILEYEVDIPEDTETGKFASQTSAISYTDTNDVVQTQEANKNKVVVGNPYGTIEIIKSFQGTNTNESLEGIEFKITNMDNTEQFFTKSTDANGHVTFENVPLGDWEITEVTQFNNYYSVPKYAKISNGEKYTAELGNAIDFRNDIKLAKLEIIKTWEDTNEIPGEVTFKITGATIGGDEINPIEVKTSTTVDEEGNKIQKAETPYVPYGDYTITETKGIYGWCAESVNVSAKSEVVTVDVVNKIAYGNLQINKTVPQGDSVSGLKFHLYGTGDISYTNKEGNVVGFNVDETITIGENGIGTLEHIPLGTYTLEEIEMPQIDTGNGAVTRYVPIKREVKISENGVTEQVDIENKWRTGNLDITVTATEGTELSDFRVKVSGTTFYGTNISEEYDVPESGKISVKNLPIGTYKVEECNTKEVDGKILTTSPDGYEVTYNPEDVNTNGVKVEYEKTANVTIHNEYTGTGIVKIVKSLEDEEDVSKAEGIQFKIKGKDYVGKDVDETITIGKDGVGISNPIPVGTYLLSEIEETVPKIYDLSEEREIKITSDNTQENPLVLQIENKLAIGEIIMETELAKGGYPSTPVTYSVTKVNDKLQALDDSIEITGDRKSYAKLENVKAGKYLIEQKNIPNGYIKDTRQVVNITREESGYALFIIDKEQVEEFEDTRVKINKQIVNEEGNIATEEDFEKAKINKQDKYSFEVKIQNVDTKETYYSFIDEKNSDTIVGLPYGTYEIEEVYKPKFKMLEITGERLTKDEETGKYTFTLSEDNEEVENKVVINITNQIDTEFGFGGQDSKDNLSKVLVEDVDEVVVTKAKIYVRDDENNKVSDATFKLYDANGKVIKLAGIEGIYFASEEGNEVISPVNGSIILKALPVGEYRLVNESVNESFLKSDDRIIIIYDSAVGVTKIELLRNIPRGSLRLSTVYTDDSGEEHYAPRSKYKILDSANNEVLTFIRKADGTYERSNLPNATEKISLKAGFVDVNGIEAGVEYQVGLVDVTEKYGIIKEEPEAVAVEEGVSKEVKVSVKDRSGMFTKVLTPGYDTVTVALDKEGKIWAYTEGSQYALNGIDQNINQLQCLNDIEQYSNIKDVKFRDIAVSDSGSNFFAIDENGKLWTWGINNKYGILGDGTTEARHEPVCISNIEGNLLYENNVKIKKVSVPLKSDTGVFALDEQGKIWFWGHFENQWETEWIPNSKTPICISDIQYEQPIYNEKWQIIDTELVDCKLKNVVIDDICDSYYYHLIAIDNNGKAWAWGSSASGACGIQQDDRSITPTCISDLEGSNIKNIKMKKVATGWFVSFLIDEENRLWAFGSSDYGALGNGDNPGDSNPICLNYNNPTNPLNGIGIVDIACQNYTIAAVDERGKLWTWGSDYNTGMLGTGKLYGFDENGNKIGEEYSNYPICISELDNNELDTVELESVAAPLEFNAAALDSDGNIWMWGRSYYLPIGNMYYETEIPPTKLTMSTKAHFDIPIFVKIDAGYEHSVAIDEEGRVWSWGNNNCSRLGTGYDPNGDDKSTSVPVCVGGYNDAISRVKIVDISAGAYHTLALDSEGKLWAWGINNLASVTGFIQDGSTTYGDPICISTLLSENNILYGKKISKIKAGYYLSAVIDDEGKLYTFGKNEYGMLGNGTVPANTYNGDENNEAKCLNDLYGYLSETKFVDISFGDDFTIALDSEGKVWAWGCTYQYGQLGSPKAVGPTPYCISEDEDCKLNGIKIKQISAGDQHSIAIDEEGKVWTWGNNYSGQLGTDIFVSSPYEIRCLTNVAGNRLYGKKIEKAIAGKGMSIAIDEEGKIWTWGSNYCGQLGQNHEETKGDILCINNDIRLIAKEISAGQNFCLALDKQGNLWSWGASEKGQAGRESDYTTHPLKLEGNTEIISPTYNQVVDKISDILSENIAGSITIENTGAPTYPSDIVSQPSCPYGTLALDKNGNLWSWGTNNEYGILGDGTTESRENPKIINDMFDGKKIISFIYFSPYTVAVMDEDYKLWMWGQNNYGQCGTGTNTNVLIPTCINANNEFTLAGILSSGNTFVIKDREGKLWAWGQNNYGECGIGTNTNVLKPTCINANNEFTVSEVLSSGSTIIIKDEEGKVWTWGENTYGQCGTGTNTHVLTPTCINANNEFTVSEVLSSRNTVIIKDEQGKLWTWGQNNYGQCGTGTNTNVLTPTCISEGKGFIIDTVIVKGTTNVIKDTEGKLWTWGLNTYGQCGTGTNTNVLEPTCINANNEFTVSEVLSSGYTFIIKDEEGKVWTWGQNNYGQCGTGTNTNVLTPTCISEEKGFIIDTVITKGYTMVIKDTEGKLWAWGRNNYGQCATGTKTNVLTPTCINANNEFTLSDVLLSGSTYIIKDTEGKLWTWGQNSDGECGTGTNTNVLTPTCITTGSEFENVNITEIVNKSNYNSTGVILAKDSEERYWTWGQNLYGRCGTGSTETYAKPKCINSIQGLENVKFETISFNSATAEAVDEDGKTWVWGNNPYGVLGVGRTETSIRTPVCRDDYFKSIGLDYASFIMKGNTNYVLDKNGDIWTWGQNTYGQCGTGTVENVIIPTCITKEKGIKYAGSIFMSNSVIIQDEDGKLWTWGQNDLAQCGTGTKDNVLEPTCISENNTLRLNQNDKCNSYNGYIYLLKENGEAWAWGNNILTPTKLNDLEEIEGQKIKEIAINYAEGKIDVLTEDGFFYKIIGTVEDGENKITVEACNSKEIIGSYGVGPWKKHFTIVTDANYTK